MCENLINRETITEESILCKIKEKTSDTVEEIDEEHDDEEKDLVPLSSIKDAHNMGEETVTFYCASRRRGKSYGALTKIRLYIMDKSLANAKQ